LANADQRSLAALGMTSGLTGCGLFLLAALRLTFT
jgi:hypothetical protein